MKKLLCVLLSIFIFSSGASAAPIGEIIGEAQNTDIVAYINHYALPSYAVLGTSVIVAEDLRNFGFDVVWDNASRTLSISRNGETLANELSFSKSGTTGSKFADLLSTDIAVYANGQKLTSYAINGYTMIPIEELTMFGSVNWVQEERAIKLWIDGFDMRSEKQPVPISSSKTFTDMAYGDLIAFLTNNGTYQNGAYTLYSYDRQRTACISYAPLLGYVKLYGEVDNYESASSCTILLYPNKSKVSYTISFETFDGYYCTGSGELTKATLNQNIKNISYASTSYSHPDDQMPAVFQQLGATMTLLTITSADKILNSYLSPVNILDLGFVNMSNRTGDIV